MGRICLVADLDGAPAERAALDSMTAWSRHDERTVEEVHGACALATLATPLEACRIARSPEGRYLAVADGRLDNGAELDRRLAVSALATRSRPAPAEIILAAFLKWGEEAADQLYGDFAFAIWDGAERRVHFARDPFGVKQLHYHQAGSRIYVATDLGAILAALPASPPINWELLQDLLAGRRDRWSRETAYRSIHRVPAGCTVSLASQGQRERAYFTFSGSDPGYRTGDEYAEHFAELLTTAISARCDGDATTGILLSGGLDSSALACLAARRDPAPAARLYSCVFPRHPDADERRYQEDVAVTCPGMPWTPLPADDAWGLREFGADAGFRLEEPEVSGDRHLLLRPLRAARADGCRVVLTGFGADQLLLGDAYHMPRLLRAIPVGLLAREVGHFSARTGRSAMRLLAETLLRPFVPSALAGAMRHRRHGPLGSLTGPTRRGVPLEARKPAVRHQAAREASRILSGGTFASYLVGSDRLAAFSGVEVRYPYLDRRLVEFVLAVPARLWFARGEEKRLLRAATVGVVPESVRRRRDHAHFSDLLADGLSGPERDRAELLLDDSRIVEVGLVDADRLAAAWRHYCDHPQHRLRLRGLMSALCVEAWLRERVSGGMLRPSGGRRASAA